MLTWWTQSTQLRRGAGRQFIMWPRLHFISPHIQPPGYLGPGYLLPQPEKWKEKCILLYLRNLAPQLPILLSTAWIFQFQTSLEIAFCMIISHDYTLKLFRQWILIPRENGNILTSEYFIGIFQSSCLAPYPHYSSILKNLSPRCTSTRHPATGPALHRKLV